MKAPRCPKHGLFMRYAGRTLVGACTNPLGLFSCHRDHEQVLTLPWSCRTDAKAGAAAYGTMPVNKSKAKRRVRDA